MARPVQRLVPAEVEAMVAMIVVGVLFACLCLVVWQLVPGFNLEGRVPEQPREEADAVASADAAHSTGKGMCLLCGGAIRRSGFTSDDVVGEVERRIELETNEVMRALHRPARESLRRMYVS